MIYIHKFTINSLINQPIGGKGTPRRKVKKIYKTVNNDDKKLQSTLKKLNVQHVPSIEEVNMFKEDGSVIHFTNPKGNNSYVVIVTILIKKNYIFFYHQTLFIIIIYYFYTIQYIHIYI